MTIFVKDDLRASVEAASGGRQTVLYTTKGQPTFMNIVPKFNLEDIDPQLGSGVHPAFIVDNKEISEIFIGTYQGIIKNDELLSLPGVNPSRSRSFDAFVDAARECGAGYHLMTNAEWAAIQLWCMKNEFQPRGNTNYGRAHDSTFETGRIINGGAPGDSSSSTAILTGSGPAPWRHDNSNGGISDLVGNIWEWVGGLRLQDGEIQILANNDAALNEADMSSKSNQWRAILLSDGSLVAPGTSGTAKYDASSDDSNTPRLNKAIEYQKGTLGDDSHDPGTSGSVSMRGLTSASDVTVPAIMKALGLAPHAVGEEENQGTLYVRNHGERLPIRGGNWVNGTYAGLGALSLANPRSAANSGRGGRLAKI